MSNHFFRFKQFTVEQEHCAMKVCTDACLFGSIIAGTNVTTDKPHYCLDIGTGTGLLSLMYAQQNNTALIDAIETDAAAAKQAADNFAASPWQERLNIIPADATQYVFRKKYDFIFSNPPFFENDLKSDDTKRNIALHSAELSLDALLCIVKTNLSSEGKFAVLLPWRRTAYVEALCLQAGFYVNEKYLVKQTPDHTYFRSIIILSSAEINTTTKEIIIQMQPGQYSPEFAALLKNYYLYL